MKIKKLLNYAFQLLMFVVLLSVAISSDEHGFFVLAGMFLGNFIYMLMFEIVDYFYK